MSTNWAGRCSHLLKPYDIGSRKSKKKMLRCIICNARFVDCEENRCRYKIQSQIISDCAWLNDIGDARDTKELASLIRQHACMISPALQRSFDSNPGDALEAICQFETHARVVLGFLEMSEAWLYLEDAGFGVSKKSTFDGNGGNKW